MTIARITDAIAAGTACVWKTSRAGATFVWVSMIANRIEDADRADVDEDLGRRRRAAPEDHVDPGERPKQTIIARPQRMMSASSRPAAPRRASSREEQTKRASIRGTT
mgnify:CR=1 FL=1